MIITAVHAKNTLRYAELKLTNIPRRGLIGVSGSNESGKTTIAEVICLALFGRTFSLDEEEISKSIKWGEFGGSVTIECVAKDGHAYHITRSFDAEGNNTAQLRRSGEQEPLVRGIQAVNQHIVQLGGFTYQQFIDSFYLAQRNLAAPHLLQQTVKTLAGVETFGRIAAECEQDIHKTQEALAALNGHVAEARRQRNDLNIQADVLPQLTAVRQAQVNVVADQEAANDERRAKLDALRAATDQAAEAVAEIHQAGPHTSFQHWSQHAVQLDEATQSVQTASDRLETGSALRLTGPLQSWLDDLRSRLQAFRQVRDETAAHRHYLHWSVGDGDRPSTVDPLALTLADQRVLARSQINGAESSRAGALVGFVAMLLLMAGAWGALWFINHAPDHAVGQWFLDDFQLSPAFNTPLFIAALVCSGLCFFCLVAVFVLSGRRLAVQQETAHLQAEEEEFKAKIQMLDDLPLRSLSGEVDGLRRCDDARLSQVVDQFANGPGASLLEVEALGTFISPLQDALKTCQVDAQPICESIRREMQSAASIISTTQQDLARLHQEMEKEEARLNKAAQLDLQVTTLETDLNTKMHQIEVRRIAQKLLAGSHGRLVGRFNLEMRHVVSKIMPQLTDGRYETMQIDKDLDLQIWSNEKGNFVGLNEISGGTYNQVMLAVRLSLSQALIASSLCGTEFIIFDEPFAFFDAQRTRKTLETLPQVSTELDQTWIISQHFDDDSLFALHLRCSGESDVLIASGT